MKVTHNTGGRDLDQMRFIFVCSMRGLWWGVGAERRT